MSELKAFRIIQGDTGGYGAPSYKCDTDGNRIEEWSDACEVYDKFEADKVIADLEESHKMEVEQLLMEIVGLKKLVETADKLLKPKGGFTIKNVTFGGVELEGMKTHKKEEAK